MDYSAALYQTSRYSRSKKKRTICEARCLWSNPASPINYSGAFMACDLARANQTAGDGSRYSLAHRKCVLDKSSSIHPPAFADAC